MRQQKCQLSLCGSQFLVIEERSRAQARAIEDDRLGKLLELWPQKDLIPAVGNLRDLPKLVHELRGPLLEVDDTEGKPLASGNVGGDVGKKLSSMQ